MPTYRIAKNSQGEEYILCLRCDLRSFNKTDIEKKFCGKCGWHNQQIAIDPENHHTWEIVEDVFILCPMCAAAVHESAGPDHIKWHESLAESFAAMKRLGIAAFNS